MRVLMPIPRAPLLRSGGGARAALPRVRSAVMARGQATDAAATDAAAASAAAASAAAATPNYFEVLAAHFTSVPEYIGIVGSGLPYPYTVFLVTMTLLLRGAVSFPLALWQRRRSERLQQVVLPEWAVWKKQIPASVWSRLAPPRATVGREMEQQIRRQIRRGLQEKWEHLLHLYDCSPWQTTLRSLAVHVPLFVVVSMLIRDGCMLPDSPLISEVIPWWSPDASFAMQTEAQRQILLDKGLEPALVDRLTKIGGPTLVDRDSTQAMPVVLGMLNMLNVELTTWTRRQRAEREAAIGLGQGQKYDTVAQQFDQEMYESPQARAISMALRLGAVVSIPIASQMPSALLVYWVSSAFCTLTQNSYFAHREAQRL